MVLPPDAYKIRLPQMIPVMQSFPDERIADIEATIAAEFARTEVRCEIKAGMSVALLVGSRGICDIARVVRAVAQQVKLLGGQPFIVPAMGSHGNGIAEEQAKILNGYGITEEYTGVPIVSSMETVIIGETPGGVPVHVDKNAYGADAIIPISRIKCHTDFSGPIESGICKMLTIGLGKHNGCSRLHHEGTEDFARILPEAAAVVINKLHVAFAMALVENAHDHLHTIRAVCGNRILEEEPGLLELSKALMPRLQFEHIDVLIVEQIGKDISGAGIDPKITGRMAAHPVNGFTGPSISRIIIHGLTEASHGNATGIGAADFITRAAYEQIDFAATYTNCIASVDPEAGRLPIVMKDEEEALRAAIQTCPHIDYDQAKVVRIKDTLRLTEIWVSDTLIEYCLNSKTIT